MSGDKWEGCELDVIIECIQNKQVFEFIGTCKWYIINSGFSCYFRIFSVIDNRLCINQLIIDNRNFNWPVRSERSQSGTQLPASATWSLSGYGAVSAVADAAVARSNCKFPWSTVAFWHRPRQTDRPVSDSCTRRPQHGIWSYYDQMPRYRVNDAPLWLSYAHLPGRRSTIVM